MRINFLSFLLLAALCTPCMAFAQTGSTPKEAAKSFGKNSNHNKKDSKKIAKPVKRQLHLAGEKEFSCPRLADHEKTDYGTFLQGSNGWFFREEMDFSENFNLFSEARFYLKRYAAALQQRNITPVFVTIPPRSWIGEAFFDDTEPVMKNYSIERAKHNFHDYLQSFRNMGIITPDLGSMADKVGTDGETFFFKRDHHWMPYGARLSSNLVRDELSKSEKYNALPKKKYETTFKEKQFLKYFMAQEIQRICEKDIPGEEFPIYITRQKSSEKAEDLFGGGADSSPPSVLVGTSFSAEEKFNFEGFLAQATGLELANYAINGGLLYNSIISYTSSEEFESAKPPFLIWEAPSNYDINANSANAFRQIIPGIYGACKGKDVLGSQTVSVGPNTTTPLLSFDPEKNITGKDYYLFLSVSNLGLAKFTLQLDYGDGDGEWFPIDRSSHFKNTGRFFVELSDEIDNDALTSVSLINPLPVKADINVRLCLAPNSKNNIEKDKKG